MHKSLAAAVMAVFFFAAAVCTEAGESACHRLTWENYSLAMLSGLLKKGEITLDDFAVDGSRGNCLYGAQLCCKRLVARFMPEKYKEIDTRFELRRACQKAKKIARRRIKEFRKNPCFVLHLPVKLGNYDFERHEFPLEFPLRYTCDLTEIPEKYEKLDVEWPYGVGKGMDYYKTGNYEWWCAGSVSISFPKVMEKIWMDTEEAEKFAASRDKVYVKYEFILAPDYQGEPVVPRREGGVNPDCKVWVYESEKMENLLACRFPSKSDVCDLSRSEYIRNIKDKRRRKVKMHLDPCNEYELQGE